MFTFCGERQARNKDTDVYEVLPVVINVMQKNKAGAVVGDVVLEGEVKEVTLSGTGHPNVRGRALQAEGTGSAKASSYTVVGITPFRPEFVHIGLGLSFSLYLVL